MKIELLYIPDCPNYSPAVRTIREVLCEQGLPQEIIEIEVADSTQAATLGFQGSPTIRINGRDVEPGLSKSSHYGLSCRTYLVHGKREGLPQREWIREAICSTNS